MSEKKLKSAISIVLCFILISSVMMSGLTALTAAAEVPSTANVIAVTDDGSREIDFNDDWQFYLATRTPTVMSGGFVNGLQDAGDYTTAQIVDVGFDDSSWRTLNVPHDFGIEGPKVSSSNGSQGYLQGGLAYYRKTFTLPESMRGKAISIDFEGVHQYPVVYLNGQEVGKYYNGYTGFAFDISDKLNYGADGANVLVIKVQDMSRSSRWYAGSGIVRPVRLMVQDQVRFIRHGVKLTSPNLETTYKQNSRAELEVEANAYSGAPGGRVKLKTSVIDADGNTVSEQFSGEVNSASGEYVDILDTVKIDANKIKLWYPYNIGDPYLYKVRTELYYQASGSSNYTLVDADENAFGFRWFRVDAADPDDPTVGGMHVNDVYTNLNGVNLHHDGGAVGAATNRDVFERQFEKLMSYGVNSYRTSHCPPSKDVIELCSEWGIIVIEEAFDGWARPKATYDFGNFWWLPVAEDYAGLAINGMSEVPRPTVDYEGAVYCWNDWVLTEMIRRDYNEASVMMWSVGNEVSSPNYNQPSWYQVQKYADASGLLDGNGNPIVYTDLDEFPETVRLGEIAKALDPTRLITTGTDKQKDTIPWASKWGYANRYLDGQGFNYSPQYFNMTHQATFEPAGTFFYESETSSQTAARGKYMDPALLNMGINHTPGRRGGSNYDNDFQAWTSAHEYNLKKDRDNKGTAGQYVWTGFDYIGEPTPYSAYPVGVSSFGIIDTAGFPKDIYYLYRSQWTDKSDPIVHITPENWDMWRDGEEVEVRVATNAKTVALYLNGELISKKSFDTKKTAYGREYYETSEVTGDDKSWLFRENEDNPDGYTSLGAEIIDASGDSEIAEGANYGRMYLRWQVPFERGELKAIAYDENGKEVATHIVSSSKKAYTVQMEASKEVIKADGRSLSYVECTVVDEDGNYVPDAENLFKFDVTGGAIVGVDNGAPESSELYKWGNIERNTHSERSAYAGKVLVILQSNKGETGTMNLTVSSEGLKTAGFKVNVTEDGTGEAPVQPDPLASDAVSVDPIAVTVPVGVVPTLPVVVTVNYQDAVAEDYSINSSVIWDPISKAQVANEGSFTVSGRVEGASLQASAVITVTARGPVTDIAANPTLGNNNQAYRFEDLASDSPLRAGALATATFTGSSSSSGGSSTFYPNNMLNGNSSYYWSNLYIRGATRLLREFRDSRPSECVEFLWDEIKAFDQIALYFTIDSTSALPESLLVEYWNGQRWIAAKNQTVDMATASNQATTITFQPVTAQRVRVYMVNARPYAYNENFMTIVTASVMSPGSYDDSADVPVNGVKLDRSTLKMYVGSRDTLTAAVLPKTATNPDVIWSSSDKSVAEVDESGKVKAIKAGTATITVTTADGGFTTSCVVTVDEKNPNQATVKAGETITIPIKLEDCARMSGMKGTLSYDQELLRLKSISGSRGFILYSSGDSFISITADGMGVDGSVIVGYAIFTATSDLEDDILTMVSLQKDSVTIMNEDKERISATLPTFEVTILSEAPMRGDVNLDGKVDLADAILLLQHISKNIELTPRQVKAADVTGDGVVNTADVIVIMQMCLA